MPDGNVSAASSLVSIVVPCCGLLEYTKLCVPSVLKFSREPFELIFLDIGALDGTAEYLAGLRDGLHGRVDVTVCRAASDLEIPRARRRCKRRAASLCACSTTTRS
jgi:hypothetical protein